MAMTVRTAGRHGACFNQLQSYLDGSKNTAEKDNTSESSSICVTLWRLVSYFNVKYLKHNLSFGAYVNYKIMQDLIFLAAALLF